ncbi:MAG: MarR family transcriptional regulator [Arcobacteraceae bacterium]
MEYVLKDSIGYRINRLANNINTQLNKLLLKYDIGIEQRAILEIIKFEPHVNQTMIAQLLGKDKTTISRSLNALEKKGLLCRSEFLHDKRSNTIRLTSKAETILVNSLEEIKELRQRVHGSLTEQETLLLFTSLNKITQAL